MRIYISIVFITALFIFYSNILAAQRATDSSAKAITTDTTLLPDDSLKAFNAILNDLYTADKKKSYLTAGISYLSNNVYLGRKDSATLPYLNFNLNYYFKSGFFIDGSANYLADSSSRIDVVNFDGGYSFTSGNYSGEAVFTKYFYNSQSTNVKSNVKSSISYFNSYDFGFIAPTFTTFLNFGTKTDVGATFGLEHAFYAIDDNLDITPTFNINGSTQNYYSNYYKTRSVKKKKKVLTSSVTGIVLNASKFKILDYEASLPVNYITGKFTFSADPVYAIPVHPSVVEVITKSLAGVTTTKYVTEKLKNTFFITLGVTYKFGK